MSAATCLLRQTRILALLGAVIGFAGCVSAATHYQLEEKYQHVLDAKTTLDREYTDLRQQVTVMEHSHGKLAGQVAAVHETVDNKVKAALAPLTLAVERTQADLRKDLLGVQQQIQHASMTAAKAQEALEQLRQQYEVMNARMERTEEQMEKISRTVRSRNQPAPERKQPVSASAGGAKEKKEKEAAAKASPRGEPSRPTGDETERIPAITVKPATPEAMPVPPPPPAAVPLPPSPLQQRTTPADSGNPVSGGVLQPPPQPRQ